MTTVSTNRSEDRAPFDTEEREAALEAVLPYFWDRGVCALCGEDNEWEVLWYDEASAELHQECFEEVESDLSKIPGGAW